MRGAVAAVALTLLACDFHCETPPAPEGPAVEAARGSTAEPAGDPTPAAEAPVAPQPVAPPAAGEAPPMVDPREERRRPQDQARETIRALESGASGRVIQPVVKLRPGAGGGGAGFQLPPDVTEAVEPPPPGP